MSAVMPQDRFTEISIKIGNRIFLDVQAAAEIAEMSARHLLRAIKDGRLKPVWFGKRNMKVMAKDLLEFLSTPKPPDQQRIRQLESRKRNR
jgi:hypothetical protein